MTYIDNTGPGRSATPCRLEPALWRLDPDVEALFTDIEQILCASLAPQRCPPPLSATLSSTRDHHGTNTGIRHPPAHTDSDVHVLTGRAKQRSPPPRQRSRGCEHSITHSRYHSKGW